MSKDLYGVLGIEKGASDQEIKRAYRRLAREFHPDVNKSDGAEKKFKEAQSAYDVLSDPQKRARYDQFGITDDQAGGGGGFEGFSGFSSGSGGFEDAFGDIFESFFGGSRGGGGRSGSGKQTGEDLRYDLTISLEEAASGLKKNVDIYYLEKKPGHKICSQCNGTGYVEVVQRTILGSISQRSVCPVCNGTGGFEREKKSKSIDIQVPAGVETGMKLRMSGEGNVGISGGPKGDLYVVITVSDHKVFKREGNDLFIEVPVPVSQVTLGTIIRIPTLDGKSELRVPAGTQPETRFRLKGKGIKNIKGFGHGDLYVIIKVDVPKKLSKEEMAHFETIAVIRKDKEQLTKVLDQMLH